MTRHAIVDLPDEAATLALGERLGARLRSGDVLALVGDLGAGKTCLARGVARGLRVADPDAVASPTYLLVVEHDGPLPMIHADAYLPAKLKAFLDDGGAAWLLERGGVVVVEWADKVAALLPERRITVRLAPRSDGRPGRRAEIDGPDELDWLAHV
ncbi:MAG: tRNA (adenosine(37)-N6)-threonylcarbamoyltransferase complex ATPase subunit type 1 TsaE [Planctomycetes bacterium]|nr:tRNA (adenosine(37)-N6)-threonylcarbamoyltransferase complex ATPase subunit type 1 TsaE [Planctomycetota bacterium]